LQSNHGQDQGGITQVKSRLGEHRLTGQQRFGDLGRQNDRPIMIAVPPIREGNEEPRIGDAFHGLVKPFRADRSAGPFTLPAKRMKELPMPPALARAN
jgi:hypothetical protein